MTNLPPCQLLSTCGCIQPYANAHLWIRAGFAMTLFLCQTCPYYLDDYWTVIRAKPYGIARSKPTCLPASR
jgi:hypothetical protein